MNFALDVLTETLEHMRDSGFIPADEDDTFADCDWEEEECPACGRDQGNHTAQMMTRCAITTFNSRSYQ